MTRQTGSGPHQVQVSGNIGVPSVANGRAIFISLLAVSSEVCSSAFQLVLTVAGRMSLIVALPILRAQGAGWPSGGNGRQLKSMSVVQR